MTAWEAAWEEVLPHADRLFGGNGPALNLCRLVVQAVWADGPAALGFASTQIAFGAGCQFAFLSPPRGRRCPPGSVVLSLGMGREPQPGEVWMCAHPTASRWTWHLLLEGDALPALVPPLLAEARAFALSRPRGRTPLPKEKKE